MHDTSRKCSFHKTLPLQQRIRCDMCNVANKERKQTKRAVFSFVYYALLPLNISHFGCVQNERTYFGRVENKREYFGRVQSAFKVLLKNLKGIYVRFDVHF